MAKQQPPEKRKLTQRELSHVWKYLVQFDIIKSEENGHEVLMMGKAAPIGHNRLFTEISAEQIEKLIRNGVVKKGSL